jgi:hypothetical protein
VLATALIVATYGMSLGSHSMLYLNTDAAHQEAVFRATREAGLHYLRMDYAAGLVFTAAGTDFEAVDRINTLAERYHVEVLGVITSTPWQIAACPGGRTDHLERCGPAPGRGRTWRRMITRLAGRAWAVRSWELGNEPDNPSLFVGGAAAYARWAALAAEGIRAGRPDAQIAIGGLAHADPAFIAAALHDPAYPLIDRIDVANIHLRGTLDGVAAGLATARAVYRDAGFDGPLWVTETGYPSRPSHQTEPGFQGGPVDQARWLTSALRSLVDGGAAVVFVSFRDNHEFGRASPFGSEGLVRWPHLDADRRVRCKPSFAAVRRLARLRR